MKPAAVSVLAIALGVSGLFAQNAQDSPASAPASPTGASTDQSFIRQKYLAVQVDKFAVKPGVEFPPEYLEKAQEEIVKQLGNAKIFSKVLPAGQASEQAGTPTIRLSGTIRDYNKGNRTKRYIAGFGPGAAEVGGQLSFLDAATGQPLRVEELRAIFTGGLFGGGDDKIVDALAQRVVLQTRFMLDRKIPPPGSAAAVPDSAPPSSDRHTLTMNAKSWPEGEQKLEQEAAAGYRVVDFTPTGQWTADVALEKFSTPPDVYQYRWVHIRLFNHLQKEVNKASADGFHAFPQSLTGLGPYLTVLMEKPPGPSPLHYQYLVAEPMSLSNAQKDAETHQREGYTLQDEAEFGVHILLFEKASAEAGK